MSKHFTNVIITGESTETAPSGKEIIPEKEKDSKQKQKGKKKSASPKKEKESSSKKKKTRSPSPKKEKESSSKKKKSRSPSPKKDKKGKKNKDKDGSKSKTKHVMGEEDNPIVREISGTAKDLKELPPRPKPTLHSNRLVFEFPVDVVSSSHFSLDHGFHYC